MNKELIEKMLSDENMIHDIAVTRTKYNHKISYQTFLSIFIESFYRIYNINVSTLIQIYATNDIIPDCTITFSNQLYQLTFTFYLDKVNNDLKVYNERLDIMSFRESAIYLINIFLDNLL